MIISILKTNQHNESKIDNLKFCFYICERANCFGLKFKFQMSKESFSHLHYHLVAQGWEMRVLRTQSRSQLYIHSEQVHIDNCLGSVDSGVIYHRDTQEQALVRWILTIYWALCQDNSRL